MLATDTVIDAMQQSKKTLVNSLITNEAIKESLIKFIDAQAEYTKQAMKVGLETVTVVTQESLKATQQAMKFDYVKFGEGIMKAYQANVSAVKM